MISIPNNATEFVLWADYLGTFAFAISGIRLAAAKRFDWFGAYVVGFVTAVGGGSLRDMMLNLTPFWMLQPSYLIITGLALIFTIAFSRTLVRLDNTLFLFDAIGLGLFTVVGVAKAFDNGFGWWVAIIMGTITGSFGGMLRDTLINEVPLIFRKDIYAIACVLGGVIYVAMLHLGLASPHIIQLISAASVVIIRIVSALYHISIPTFKGDVMHKHSKAPK
ncbi:membrane protein [Porphyromonas macacae]|uniref:Membrane protein n=1 Tax=Porphyromonas macacae TaxID=28115 RepID=A0A0A2EAC7_9PORP|nr:trimeric intracellular cation channel family protein [Porphyromonas macacae]KGN74400.1 membrane protein [Porphyromonas macacae]KGN99458.1 membrane protein [Porphyromonas macacae]SUB88788.1 Predicted membrane protein [Porphyromonas macacae]